MSDQKISIQIQPDCGNAPRKLFLKDLNVAPTIITHGRDASVSGKIVTKHDLQFSFCNIYKFKGTGGTTINSITTFIIAL